MFLQLRNGKSGLKEFNKALRCDPKLWLARIVRLKFWTESQMKSQAELFAECRSILRRVHKDWHWTDVVYAIMSRAVMCDPRLGTFEESRSYYKKSLEATERRVEIYGPRAAPEPTLHAIRKEMHRVYEEPEGDTANARRFCDQVDCSDISIDDLDFVGGQGKLKRNACVACARSEDDESVKLRKCLRCEKVRYCSKDCQRKHWHIHKAFCNEVSGYNRRKEGQKPVEFKETSIS